MLRAPGGETSTEDPGTEYVCEGEHLPTPRLFYGWVIVLVSALVAFASSPGQSYIFAIFIDSIIEDTALTRTAISSLYALGTGLSAVMVMVMSRLADRYGTRPMIAVASSGLGLACLAMWQAQGLIVVFIAFAALRALGQGSMTINATVLVAQWFILKRGRAMALMGLGATAGLAILPPTVRLLIDAIGWRETYLVLGVMVFALVVPTVLLLVRERPEDVGLFPDGADTPPAEEVGERDRRPLLTSLHFWLIAGAGSTPALVITGLVFHQVAIFDERGLSATVAAAVFVPYAVATALMSLAAGFITDRFGPRGTFVGSMVALLVAMGLLTTINTVSGAVVYVVVSGISGGMAMVVGNVIWAHFYGRTGLGRVQGTAMMIAVAASALGPLPLAAMESLLGGFTPGIAVLAVLPVLAIVAMLTARPPVRIVALA